MTRHLLHIGYSKAGSTFLQEWFARHPDLCYQPGGLGGFRDVYAIARPSNLVYRYYVTSYEGLSAPHESAGGVRFAGEPEPDDPIKANQATVCSLLQSLYPASRVLIVTRGFRGIILSGYSQYVRAGGVEHLPGMCRALSPRRNGEGCAHFDVDYLIRLYVAAFGEEQVIVLPYELLRDDPRGFLAVLEQELGLDHVEIDPGVVNPSLSPEELYWYPVISRGVMAVASRLRPTLSRRVYRRYVAQVFRNRLRPLVRLLSLLRPGRRITGADLPGDVLRHCEGKATLLRDRPLFAPYASEYLVEGRSERLEQPPDRSYRELHTVGRDLHRATREKEEMRDQ